jgi:hypothetical protein
MARHTKPFKREAAIDRRAFFKRREGELTSHDCNKLGTRFPYGTLPIKLHEIIFDRFHTDRSGGGRTEVPFGGI